MRSGASSGDLGHNAILRAAQRALIADSMRSYVALFALCCYGRRVLVTGGAGRRIAYCSVALVAVGPQFAALPPVKFGKPAGSPLTTLKPRQTEGLACHARASPPPAFLRVPSMAPDARLRPPPGRVRIVGSDPAWRDRSADLPAKRAHHAP